MKHFINVERDSWNSYPNSDLVIEKDKSMVTLSLSDDISKEIIIEVNEFSQMLYFFLSGGNETTVLLNNKSTWNENKYHKVTFTANDDHIWFKINEYDDQEDSGYSERELFFLKKDFFKIKNYFELSFGEASMTINGNQLSVGMAMTVRVALESFASSLHADGLGEDQIGIDIKDGYLNNINKIREIM